MVHSVISYSLSLHGKGCCDPSTIGDYTLSFNRLYFLSCTVWLDTGLTEARRVGRIHGEQGSGLASGFLFDGALISEAYQSLPLFLTCNHCVGGSSQTLGIPWSSGAVVFQQMQTDPSVQGEAAFLQLLAESPSDELNYSLLLLDRWPGKVADLRIAPKSPQPELNDRVFIRHYRK